MNSGTCYSAWFGTAQLWASLDQPLPASMTPSCTSGSDDDDPCFPSSAIVTKADGTPSRIDALKDGDAIIAATEDGGLTTDVISMLSIAMPNDKAATYITFSTDANATLTLTPRHHLSVGSSCCSTLKLAEDVAVGETVWTVSANALVATTITAKTRGESSGLHSPVLTNGGFPIVDGLVTSFDSIDKVTLAKHGLAPLLNACKATGTCDSFREMFLSTDDRRYIV